MSLWLTVCFPLVLLSQTDPQETQTAEQKTKNNDDLFEMSFEELMEMQIITAAKTPEEIGDIPASVIIVTRRDIERYGYSSLTEILENIPGLFAIDDYSFQGANFGIRGFWSGVANDNIMILLNGVQQVYDPGSNYPLALCTVPIEAIDRIDIIRGPMSVMYGCGAFFGVINIITDATVFDRTLDAVSVVSGSLGTEKTRKLSLRLDGTEGEFHFVFNGSIYSTYGIDEPLSKMISDPETLTDYNLPVNARTGGHLQWQQKYFDFSGSYKGFHLQIKYSNSQQESYFLMPTFSKGNINRLEGTRIALTYHKKWSELFSLDAKFNYSFLRDWYKLNYLSDTFYGIQEIASHAWEIEVNTFLTPSEKLDITTGLYYRTITDVSNHYDIPSLDVPSLVDHFYYLEDGDAIETQAFFTQVNYKPLSKLTLVGGLRLEQMPAYAMAGLLKTENNEYHIIPGEFNQKKIEIIPRFATIWKLNSKNILKLLYGKAINRSSFLQNQRNILVSCKEALLPERIQTIELNWISALNSSLTLQAGVFHNRLENLVTRVVELDNAGEYTSWSDNGGKLATTGLELTFQGKFFPGLALEISGIFQKTKNKNPEQGASLTGENTQKHDVPYSPKLLGYIKASYEGNHYLVSITGNYVSGMESYWEKTVNPTGQSFSPIGNRVPGYFNLSMNIRVEDIFIAGLFMNLRVTNLLDTEIRYPTFTNNSWADLGTLGRSCNFLLSAGLKF